MKFKCAKPRIMKMKLLHFCKISDISVFKGNKSINLHKNIIKVCRQNLETAVSVKQIIRRYLLKHTFNFNLEKNDGDAFIYKRNFLRNKDSNVL